MMLVIVKRIMSGRTLGGTGEKSGSPEIPWEPSESPCLEQAIEASVPNKWVLGFSAYLN